MWKDGEIAELLREGRTIQKVSLHPTARTIQYTSRVLEVEQATFTPLVFSTTGGMVVECNGTLVDFQSQLLLRRAKVMRLPCHEWIWARVSFSLLRSVLLCLRGSRASRRVHLELSDVHSDFGKGRANIR